MAETTRDILIRLGIEQKDAEIKAPKIKGATDALESAKKASQEWQKQILEAQKKLQETLDKTGKKRERTTNEALAQSRKLEQANARLKDSLMGAAEGALTVARGTAFIWASNEKDMQRGLRVIAAIQGGVDMFKGTVGVVRNLSAAWTAYRTAATAAAAANTALSTTGTAATVALGPIGLAIAGITAVIAIGALAWSAYGDEVESASDRAVHAIEKVKGSTLDLDRALQGIEARRTSALSSLAGGGEGSAKILTDRIADIKSELMSLGKEQERAEKRFALDLEAGPLAQGVQKMKGQLARAEKLLAKPTFISSRTLRAARAQKRIVERKLPGREEDLAAQRAEGLQKIQSETLREQVSLVSERIRHEQNLHSIIKSQAKDREEAQQRQVELGRQAIKQHREEVEAIRDKIKAEKDRLSTLDEIFGRMTAMDRARLRELSEKAKAGKKFSRFELLEAEKLAPGFAGKFVGGEFAKEGLKAGSREIAAAFGLDAGGKGSRLEGLGEQLAKGVADQTALGEKLAALMKEFADKDMDQSEKQIAILEKLVERRASLETELAKLEDALEVRKEE